MAEPTALVVRFRRKLAALSPRLAKDARHPTRRFTLAIMNAAFVPHSRRSDSWGYISESDQPRTAVHPAALNAPMKVGPVDVMSIRAQASLGLRIRRYWAAAAIDRAAAPGRRARPEREERIAIETIRFEDANDTAFVHLLMQSHLAFAAARQNFRDSTRFNRTEVDQLLAQ
jgi:hypothetical protein